MVRWLVYELRETELGRLQAQNRRQAEATAVQRYGVPVSRVQAVASIEVTANNLGSAPRLRARSSPVRAHRNRKRKEH